MWGSWLAAAVKVATARSCTESLAGWVVTTGRVLRVKVAGVESTVPTLLVNAAWYWLPLSPAAVVKVYVLDVAPGMSVKVVPPLVETCHWTVGAGVPWPAAVKVAGRPWLTVSLAGLVVTTGRESTVRETGSVPTVPTELVNTAWYWFPLSEGSAVTV